MHADLSNEEQSLSAVAMRRVDQHCDRFEQFCDAGQQPKIETFLQEAADSEQSVLLRYLIRSELEHRCRGGTRPSADEYRARFPQHQDLVAEEFADFPWNDVIGQAAKASPRSPDMPADVPADMPAGASQRRRDGPRQLGDRYTVQSEIGAGGCAIVLLAVDQQLGRQVAIKVPRPDHPLDFDVYVTEAQTVAQLDHPAIVQVYDIGRDEDGRPFAVMQYIDGQSLAQHLKSSGMSPGRAAQLLAQVAEAVHHAHQHGFVHRDLKPSNILLDRDGNPFVSDFGLALHERDLSQHRGDYSGTPLYRSPEQVRGEANWMDGRCDVWSLGVVLYEMLTGRRPFGTSEEIQLRPPKPPRQVDDRIPERLEQICLRCLSKTVDGRYATADALARELRNAFAALVADGELAVDGSDGSSALSGRDNIIIIQNVRPVVPDKPASSDPIRPNPYMGLFAFAERDADRFFGREESTERIIQRFRTLHEDTRREKAKVRLLPIVGPSGCGKSSLVRAGLIAQLAQNPLTDWRDIRVVVLQPGTRPLESLATALAKLMTSDAVPLTKSAELREILRQPHEGEFDGLRQIGATLSSDRRSPLIVFVDQMDEIYSLCDDAQERNVFLDNLLVAAAEVGGRVSVIFTLRSDFLGETHDHPWLNALIAEQAMIVPAMTKDQLRSAIAEPARAAGHPLDAASVDLLTEQTYGREGALPLLQFTLSRIWQGLVEGAEPADTLKRLGGVGGALAGEAQRIYDSLDGEDQEVARRVFLSLVQLGQGAPDTRRRVGVQSLVAHDEDPARVRGVMERFATPGARLLTLSAASDDGAESVEVTHEAIIDNWPQMRKWLDESRADLRFQRRLDEAARHWQHEAQPEGLLWRSPDLDRLRRFHQRWHKEMTPVQIKFFIRSGQVEDENRLRQKRRFRLYQYAALVFAVLAIATTFLGFRARRLAVDAGERLVRLNLNEGIQRIDDQDLMSAVPKLVEALRLVQDQPRQASQHRLRLGAVLARCPKPVQVFHDDRTIVYAELSPGGRQLCLAGRDGTVKLWDVTTGQTVLTINAHQNTVRIASFNSDGSKLITASSDGTARVWDAKTGQPLTPPLQHDKPLRHAAFGPTGRLVVTAGEDGTARLWNLKGEPLVEPMKHEGRVNFAAFRPDGKQLLTTSDDKTAVVWNTTDGGKVVTFDHDGPVYAAAFCPDGTRVLTGSDDSTARLWSQSSGQPMGEPMRHDHYVRFAAFGPRGRYVATASFDGTARLWSATSGARTEVKVIHAQVVNHAAFDADGRWLATASSDGTVQVTSTKTGRPVLPLLRHSAGVSRVFFRDQRRELITVAQDGVVRVWRVPEQAGRDDAPLPHRGAVMSASVSPDKHRIVTAGRDHTARIWDVETGRLAVWPMSHPGPVENALFDRNSKRIVTFGAEEKYGGRRVWPAVIWEADTGFRVNSVPFLLPLPPRAADFSPSGRYLVMTTKATGSNVGQVIILDLDHRAVRGVPMDSDERALHAAFTRDGSRLAVASGSLDGSRGLVRFFAVPDDLAEGPLKLVASAELEGNVNFVAFSPDGTHFATAAGAVFYSSMGALHAAGEACVWDATTYQRVSQPLDHTEAVTKVVFSPDGKRLATVSAGHTVQVWETLQGREISRPMRHDDSIGDLAFSFDGQTLITAVGAKHLLAQTPGYLRIWDASSGDPITPNLISAGPMFLARFLGEDLRFVTAGKHGARIWRFQPDGRPVEDLVKVGEVLSGRIADESASPNSLPPKDYVDRWHDLREKFPERFSRDAVPSTSAGADYLVARDSQWRYSDRGVDLNTSWRQPDFEDSRWPSGKAQLGYGEADEATVLDSTDAPVATYFRHTFGVAEPQAIRNVVMTLTCDDGAHVYLNGIRVVTCNLNVESAYDEPAIETIAGRREDLPLCLAIDPGLLVSGQNLVAVEVHQADNTSEEPHERDLSFDLTLTANASDIYAKVLRKSALPWDRAQAAYVLGQLGKANNLARASLTEALQDTNQLVQLWAAASLLLIEPESPDALSSFAKPDEYASMVLARYLNHPSWTVAMIPGLTQPEYQAALRAARVLIRVKPAHQNGWNTLGVAQYRVGDYAGAIESLRYSDELLQESGQTRDPSNHLFIAMAHYQLDKMGQAAEYLQQGLDLMDQATAPPELGLRLFRDEATELLSADVESTD